MKGAFDHYVEFWGDYKWPFQHYLRYELCASLENEADNFQDMSKALSNLTKVRELGLSVDSGLGFLSGPDISDRARIFHQKPTVFGPTKTDADAKFAKRQNLWEGIVSSLKTPSVFMADDTLYNNRSLDMEILGYYECESETEEEEDEVDEEDEDPPSKPKKTLFLTHVTPQDGSDRPLVFQGVEITNQAILGLVCPEVSIINVRQVHHDGPFATAPLKPNNLTIPQKEWLLETEWAQRAFLSSYSMALFDKSQTFHHVHSLAIGMISSRYLSMLQRQGIWGSLPQLETLSINVSADWRDILSSEVGVEAPDIQPSDAATHFHTLLEGCISAISGIKVLKLGYVGGGERQTGIFGRNRWILPAPLTNFSVHTEALSGRAAILKLPHVEHLTLTNCWIAPHMLKIFVRNMRTANLRTLTLDSVSLAARMGNVEATERDPLANGTTRYAKGPPRRFGDTAVGNLFQQRGAAPDPRLDGTGWAILPRPIGSWGDVINVITPGPTKDLIRYAYQVRDEAPLRYSGILERINFISCGYASLFYMRLDSPPDLGEIEHKVPARLRKRTLDLIPLMMNSRDPLLAHIIPEMKEQDLEVFDTAFPMVMGWDDESQWDNYEDGQPAGGSGRFSGHVEKLTFPEESSAEESSPNGD